MPNIQLLDHILVGFKDRFFAYQPIWKETDFPEIIPTYLKSVSSSFENSNRRNLFLQSRLMIHEMLDSILGIPNDLLIQKDQWDKPFGIVDQKLIHLSISHTREAVFVIIDLNKRVGLDAERIDRKIPANLRARILHPNESHDNQFETIETILIWVVKESILKLLGSGLRLSMSSISLISNSTQCFQSTIDGKAIQSNVITFKNHYIAISEYI